LGKEWLNAKEFDKSLFYYKLAIEKNPNYVEAYVNLGSAYFNMRSDYTTALKYFEKAISIQPSHSLAHVNLGNALRELGKFGQAQKEYDLALELDPDKEPKAHEYARIGIQLIQSDIVDKILMKDNYNLDDLNQFKNLSPISLNNFAYEIIISGERLDKAAEMLKLGLEKDPNYSYLYATNGLFHFKQGDLKKGRALYKHAINLSAVDIELQQKFHYEYGVALRIKGNFKKAIFEFQQAQKTSSKYVPEEEIEAEIRKAKEKNKS